MNKLRLANQLFEDEGFEPCAYQDSLGYWTIGIGRLIDKRKGGGITKAEAMGLLDNDIQRVWSELIIALPWFKDAPETVQEVLANMCFNLGLGGLLKFKTTLGLLQTGEYSLASQAMLDSAWAKQVGPRADRLSKRIEALGK